MKACMIGPSNDQILMMKRFRRIMLQNCLMKILIGLYDSMYCMLARYSGSMQ
jgi:hypothetical protein